MEFSKSERAKARELINKAVEIEFAMGLQKFDKIIEDWKYRKTETRESYYAIFEGVKEFDKQIAWRYDHVTNSNIEFLIVQLYSEKILNEEDLSVFRPETQEYIKMRVKRNAEFE
jgi:hypothetical protein